MEQLLNDLMKQALKFDASDIHFSHSEAGIIEIRSQGKMKKFKKIDKSIYIRLMNYIKFLANIDLNYKFKPQTGSYDYHLNKKHYSIRVSFMPSIHGESMVLRILNNHEKLSLENLSYYPHVLDKLKKIVNKHAGLVIVCGKTGSGKSTTLYTLLESIYQKTQKKIITVEDPIEIQNNNFIQIQLNEAMGITFHNTLKQILRHDPDVIMIGEIRDETSARIALTMALTGHLTLTTLHANNCESAINRLNNLGIQDNELKDCLIAVISQKMFYPKQLNHPFCVHEIIEEKEIKHFFKHQIFPKYPKFDDLIYSAIKMNYLSVMETSDNYG